MPEPQYVVIRTENAGAWVGIMETREGNEVVLRDARRLWYWSGASSLSELAVMGVSKPDACKFPIAVDAVRLIGVIEIINMTPDAVNNIKGVPVWTQH